MVIVSPLRIGLFPFQMAFSWIIHGGDPNHVKLTGMILQVGRLRGCQTPLRLSEEISALEGGGRSKNPLKGMGYRGKSRRPLKIIVANLELVMKSVNPHEKN